MAIMFTKNLLVNLVIVFFKPCEENQAKCIPLIAFKAIVTTTRNSL